MHHQDELRNRVSRIRDRTAEITKQRMRTREDSPKILEYGCLAIFSLWLRDFHKRRLIVNGVGEKMIHPLEKHSQSANVGESAFGVLTNLATKAKILQIL